MVDAVMEALRRLRQNSNISIMLVEQRIQEALDLSDRVFILNRGRLQDTGRKPASLTREEIEAAYFEH
jgi:branched-chain amino acid transport system ATP-binding protein